ncbi:MAG: hypothetical protein KC503_14720 [Myxococcales bacterium]|nr:hypothetical protein [Myxococcales bacterium]
MTALGGADGALFEYRRGLHLRGTVLWFDAPRARDVCFVSSAAISGAHRHEKILCTGETAELLHALAEAHGRGRRVHEPRALVTPYGRPFSLGKLRLELFPAGYVLGSASLLVEHEGRRIVYAGPINPRERPPIERLEARRCDVLVLTGGYAGANRVVLPPAGGVREQIVRFVDAALEAGETPVLLSAVLGEAQELVALLGDRPLRLHRRIHAVTSVYAGRGAGGLREATLLPFRATVRPGETLIWPATLRDSPALSRLERRRVALVSAHAHEERPLGKTALDGAFAYSAQADYSGLLEYVRACQPSTVVLTGGYCAELTGDLSALGITVLQAGPEEQLPLF